MNHLVTFFPNWNIALNQSAVAKKWFEQFEACTDREFRLMVQRYIDHETYHPTVAGLKKYWVKEQKKCAEQLAWEQVMEEQERKREQEGRLHDANRTS